MSSHSSGPDKSVEARRRRIAEVFGDVLPDTTSDEREPDRDTDTGDERRDGDSWLRAQVPPHHG